MTSEVGAYIAGGIVIAIVGDIISSVVVLGGDVVVRENRIRSKK